MNKLERISSRHRIRKLLDGRYVAEERTCLFFWEAIDLSHPQFKWKRGSNLYRCCIGSREDAIKAIAARGY